MRGKLTRRQMLKASAAAGAALALPAPFIGRSRAASGKITIGMEAGSPYDTFYRNHVAEFTEATGVEVTFNAIPHDNIRQQFVQDALSGSGGFDVYIADQVWLPEFYQNGFIVDLTGHVSDEDRSRLRIGAATTVQWMPSVDVACETP